MSELILLMALMHWDCLGAGGDVVKYFFLVCCDGVTLGRFDG